MILSAYERMIARRYLLPGRGEGFIFLVAGISLFAVMLGVAALITVMSVMNGFRAELFDKIVGLNGHAIIQGYAVPGAGSQLEDWRRVAEEARRTPGVTSATPLIERPLMAQLEGRVEGVLARGMRIEDIRANRAMTEGVKAGSISALSPNSGNVAIGAALAANLGASLGSEISVLSPQGQTTPFGTVPRIVSYRVAAIFETGVYHYDEALVVMPLEDAQMLLMLGDAVEMVEVDTEDADRVGEILAPLAQKIGDRAMIRDWRSMNASLFEALQVDRVVTFTVLSLIILVAAFNILSSLIMLVRAKTRDIAILRTMGASRASMMRVFITVGVAIGALGTALGLVLGLLLIRYRQGVLDLVHLLTGQNIWDPSVRFLADLPARTDPVETTTVLLVALGLSFLATLYPAWKAASTDPVQVLRYE